MRRKTLLATVTLAAALLAVPAAADIADRLDQKAPEVSCSEWWNGKAPKIAKLKGRVVVVHFHDPNRITSKAFEGKVKELAEANADRPFTLIEVIVDCDEVDAQSYVARAGADWLVGWDGKGDCAAAYSGSSVPRTYLIGPDGMVAWHAHIAALTEDALEAQYARARWFDVKSLPRKSKTAAKAARELRFGAATKEAKKLIDDQYATDKDKSILAEIERYHAFQMKVVTALEKDLDWGIALKRVERMREIYKGTAVEEDVEKEWRKLDANPRVAYVAEAERLLGLILEKTDIRKKRDLESGLNELRLFVGDYDQTKPAERARTWIKEFERRLAQMEKR
jgi:hypothetical protein